MDFFETVRTRRSVRKFSAKKVPEVVVEKALEAALLAPNSSNMQMWQFHWVHSEETKKRIAVACFDQNAAKTAQEIIVVSVARSLWKRNQKEMVRVLKSQNAPKFALDYYQKLIPFLYGWTWLAPLKFIIYNVIGLFRPIARRPWSARDIDEVCIKSAALACENLMLAFRAQGFDTCPMEGFDEWRIKKILGLKCQSRVVMCVGVGERIPEGIWGDQIRFNPEWFIHKV